ncbi:hypothetical protein KP79_PYT11414 [Mizuhopecten yessoensis]|uniref:Uncharacterized protein n=1 Tax=Mizuhopecten yessoensis TaxID=6573 RepID=A0A210QUX4_MIZYE|nr:hypothetical protein KP79_PYT11414 [Mizuhopecten yessoensis]
MASSQPDDKGARPKTNSQSNSGHKKERGRAKHDNQSGSDVEKDSVPNSEQGNVPPGVQQLPYLVDVAVIYAKEDYDQVETEFVPWLKEKAMKFNLVGARIHLYDDSDVCSEANVFSQTMNVTTKCMKILAFITDKFMKDKILTGVLEELIMMTRFITEDEAKQHISKISEKLHPVRAKYLSECVQRQKVNALIPVQTVDKNINFIGLKAITPIPFYDLEKNSGFKERKAQGVIKVAMEDRRKLQQYITNSENRAMSSCEHQNASSREHPQAASVHATQLISYSSSPQNMGNPPRNQWQNNNYFDDEDRNETSRELLFSSNQSGHSNNVPILEEKEKKTDNNDSRTANTDLLPESSNTVDSNGQESSAEPRLEGDEGASESGNSQDEGLGSEHIHPSQVSTSTENSTLETSEETKVSVHGDPAATPVMSNGDDTPETDLEEDQLESGRADNTEIKTVCALTESGYDSLSGEEQLQQKGESKPVKDPGETSLDNTGLVNDSGDAALGKDLGDANLKSSKQESMLSTDAQKEDKEPHFYSKKWKSSIEDQGKVLENTLTYSGGQRSSKGLMAGNVPQKDSDRRCPAGSDVPDPSTHMKGKQPPEFSPTLFPYLTGTNYKEGPVLTIVHHHLYEKSEPKPPSPPPPPQPAQDPPQTINVFGANTVMIGKHSKAVMSEPTMISTHDPKSHQPEPDVAPTTQQTTQKDVQSDTGAESPSTTPTTSSGSLNDLSPSLQPSTYNFPKSAEQTNEGKETGCQNVEGKKAADQTEGKKTSDSCEDSSSDEDNSLVSTHRSTGDVPEKNFEILKERNLKDMEEHKQITNKSDLSSLEDNRSWKSEAEDVLGPSLSDDLVSLAASGEDTSLPDRWDAVKPDQCTTTGQQIEAADHEGQGQVGTETCAERQPLFIGGPQPAVSSLQTTSLFASILSVKQQFHIHSGILKTNVLGMMAQSSMFLQEVRTDQHKQDDDVD